MIFFFLLPSLKNNWEDYHSSNSFHFQSIWLVLFDVIWLWKLNLIDFHGNVPDSSFPFFWNFQLSWNSWLNEKWKVVLKWRVCFRELMNWKQLKFKNQTKLNTSHVIHWSISMITQCSITFKCSSEQTLSFIWHDGSESYGALFIDFMMVQLYLWSDGILGGINCLNHGVSVAVESVLRELFSVSSNVTSETIWGRSLVMKITLSDVVYRWRKHHLKHDLQGVILHSQRKAHHEQSMSHVPNGFTIPEMPKKGKSSLRFVENLGSKEVERIHSLQSHLE